MGSEEEQADFPFLFTIEFPYTHFRKRHEVRKVESAKTHMC